MKTVLSAFLGVGRALADGLVHQNPATLWKLVTTVGAPPFERLLGGRDVAPEGEPLVDGRRDLRGSVAPSGAQSSSPHGPGFANVTTVALAKTRWTSLDLSRSRLRSFRFHRARIEGCRFEEADCEDWRLWGTEILDTSFQGANLRDTALGAVSEGRRNRYVRVDFRGADLRGSGHHSADFEHCDFSGARLDDVDFQGSVFSHCRFAGEMSGVLFHRHGFRGESNPPNEMAEVDFSSARFHWVEFRGLDMLTVRWPDAKDHLQVHHYARTLDRIIEVLGRRTDRPAKGLVAALENRRKWVGPNQQVGIISQSEVDGCGDPELFSVLQQLVKQ